MLCISWFDVPYTVYTIVKLGASQMNSQRPKACGERVFACWLIMKHPGFSGTNTFCFRVFTKCCTLTILYTDCIKTITSHPF